MIEQEGSLCISAGVRNCERLQFQEYICDKTVILESLHTCSVKYARREFSEGDHVTRWPQTVEAKAILRQSYLKTVQVPGTWD